MPDKGGIITSDETKSRPRKPRSQHIGGFSSTRVPPNPPDPALVDIQKPGQPFPVMAVGVNFAIPEALWLSRAEVQAILEMDITPRLYAEADAALTIEPTHSLDIDVDHQLTIEAQQSLHVTAKTFMTLEPTQSLAVQIGASLELEGTQLIEEQATAEVTANLLDVEWIPFSRPQCEPGLTVKVSHLDPHQFVPKATWVPTTKVAGVCQDDSVKGGSDLHLRGPLVGTGARDVYMQFQLDPLNPGEIVAASLVGFLSNSTTAGQTMDIFKIDVLDEDWPDNMHCSDAVPPDGAAIQSFVFFPYTADEHWPGEYPAVVPLNQAVIDYLKSRQPVTLLLRGRNGADATFHIGTGLWGYHGEENSPDEPTVDGGSGVVVLDHPAVTGCAGWA